ncbi:chloroplast envelope quinone oxidoreductase homolog [Physcomitrium patens]|uniref:chloroplast envelope quinone oxidoreductase homolog n=1 Tax=Physcomitrium patens TaxID=3218 RepID=UPI000D17B24F|nr:chloroplast envelope quinone oxidoreductase homolog [Physcomitrium patens]|eukprot:XP_024370363.1 chloroplast envelope quinone oxidoreductase homolog [Physcomitrella patens]
MEVLVMDETLLAVQYSKYHGGPSALEYMISCPMPTPNVFEMLVKVEACGVNVVDWRFQDDLRKYVVPCKFPHVPGCDLSGEVVMLGPWVVGFEPGEKIISWISPVKGGGYAEYAVTASATTMKRPPGVSVVEAASLPRLPMTALRSAVQVAGLKLDGSGPKLNVLITAASGEVGPFWTQIAKLCGCHVTATCGSHNTELVRSLGADEVLDYKSTEGAKYTSPSGKKSDVVVHLAPYKPEQPSRRNSQNAVQSST